ncbi:hypothetical protein CBM2634_U480005 [Cupriavidus taiwanensis]|uniref:Uncharacterized protein n=1 Tax=Cupriavidus taiwanensis TaxID=164546 RepID=A0A375JCS0_9BURK|nr:hypothetical protein CBM2634_U480005 [Cupriavidus taiwanensis]
MGEQRFQQCKYKFAGSRFLASFRSQCSAVSVHSHFRASAPLGQRQLALRALWNQRETDYKLARVEVDVASFMQPNAGIPRLD